MIGLALTVAIRGTAAAGSYAIGPDVQVSGRSTVTDCPFGASADLAAAYDNTEVEPQVAVDPTNPVEITGVSQQDRWPDGGARGLTSWMSTNGATSWTKLPDVPWSACQGGPGRFLRVADPWVSFDAAGNLYFIGQPIRFGGARPLGDLRHDMERHDLVRATDPDRGHGRTWNLE
jgi:hypothetical protein